jgi:3-oxoacyl-[acyl-carrier protein] reductase
MELNLNDQFFVITGASSGLGEAVLERLVAEGSRVLAVARRGDILKEKELRFPDQVEGIIGDVREEKTIKEILDTINGRKLHGVFINAGGPPAMSVEETTLNDWDDAYDLLLRWKVRLVKLLLPGFQKHKYGRILFSESSSVRQPVENLVLSNSVRLAVVGLSKTISVEYAKHGITSNTIGPGYHDTAAVERLYQKKSQNENISIDEARQKIQDNIPVGFAGNPHDFATLAVWLLSSYARFVTGQVYCLDGGAIRGTL